MRRSANAYQLLEGALGGNVLLLLRTVIELSEHLCAEVGVDASRLFSVLAGFSLSVMAVELLC